MSKPIRHKLPNGDTIFLYYMKELSKRMSMSAESVRNMEKRGAIPKTPFRTVKSNYRLYTDEQMNILARCARKCNIRNGVSFKKCGFVDMVYKEHNRLLIRYGII